MKRKQYQTETGLTTESIQKIVCEMEVLSFNLPCENLKYIFFYC
jgi:hypothetical protein